MSMALLEINNDIAYDFLHNMERMNMVRIINRQNARPQKMSERFADTLKLTDKQYQNMQSELIQMRNEWERNIY